MGLDSRASHTPGVDMCDNMYRPVPTYGRQWQSGRTALLRLSRIETAICLVGESHGCIPTAVDME